MESRDHTNGDNDFPTQVADFDTPPPSADEIEVAPVDERRGDRRQYGVLGQTVLYRLSGGDAEAINTWRKQHGSDVGRSQVHAGNQVSPGDRVPMVVVAEWSDTCVNGQVLLDGNDSLWVTSANRGDQPGQWDNR